MSKNNHCSCYNCAHRNVCIPKMEITEVMEKAKHFNSYTKDDRPTVGVTAAVYYKLAQCCTKFKLK